MENRQERQEAWLPLLSSGKTGGEGKRQTKLIRLHHCCCVGLQWLVLKPGLRSTPSSKDSGEGHSQRLQGGKRPGEGRAGQKSRVAPRPAVSRLRGQEQVQSQEAVCLTSARMSKGYQHIDGQVQSSEAQTEL